MTERFVFPRGDWARAAAAELDRLGYVTTLDEHDAGTWTVSVTGSPAAMLRMRRGRDGAAASPHPAAGFDWPGLLDGVFPASALPAETDRPRRHSPPPPPLV